MNDRMDLDDAVVYEKKGDVRFFKRNFCLNQSAFQRFIGSVVGNYPSEVGQTGLALFSGG